MEKRVFGQAIEKGQIVEMAVPNVENPIQAVVLDVIGYSIGDNSNHYECIMYAQKRLFKASFEFNWSIEPIYDDEDEDPYISDEIECHYYSDLKYEGIIVEYCDIPTIPF